MKINDVTYSKTEYERLKKDVKSLKKECVSVGEELKNKIKDSNERVLNSKKAQIYNSLKNSLPKVDDINEEKIKHIVNVITEIDKKEKQISDLSEKNDILRVQLMEKISLKSHPFNAESSEISKERMDKLNADFLRLQDLKSSLKKYNENIFLDIDEAFDSEEINKLVDERISSVIEQEVEKNKLFGQYEIENLILSSKVEALNYKRICKDRLDEMQLLNSKEVSDNDLIFKAIDVKKEYLKMFSNIQKKLDNHAKTYEEFRKVLYLGDNIINPEEKEKEYLDQLTNEVERRSYIVNQLTKSNTELKKTLKRDSLDGYIPTNVEAEFSNIILEHIKSELTEFQLEIDASISGAKNYKDDIKFSEDLDGLFKQVAVLTVQEKKLRIEALELNGIKELDGISEKLRMNQEFSIVGVVEKFRKENQDLRDKNEIYSKQFEDESKKLKIESDNIRKNEKLFELVKLQNQINTLKYAQSFYGSSELLTSDQIDKYLNRISLESLERIFTYDLLGMLSSEKKKLGEGNEKFLKINNILLTNNNEELKKRINIEKEMINEYIRLNKLNENEITTRSLDLIQQRDKIINNCSEEGKRKILDKLNKFKTDINIRLLNLEFIKKDKKALKTFLLPAKSSSISKVDIGI